MSANRVLRRSAWTQAVIEDLKRKDFYTMTKFSEMDVYDRIPT